MRLEELDLTKKSFEQGSFKKGLENTHHHIDINTKDSYLVKINNKYYAGTFGDVWFGLNFYGGPWGSLQYDKPNTNSSGWEKVWLIIDDE